MSKFTFSLASILTVSSLALMQTGCATKSVEKRIAQELIQLLDYQDCPTVCFALKTYIEQRLGVPVPVEIPEEVEISQSADEVEGTANE